MLDRLMQKITIDPVTNCWIWQGYRNKDGYGCLTYLGREWKAHRLFFHLTKGLKHPKSWVLHSCDNPPCVNPDHLREGTPRENSQEAWERGAGKRKYPVPDEIIKAMLAEFAVTGNMNATARKFGKSTGYTWRIVNRQLKRRII